MARKRKKVGPYYQFCRNRCKALQRHHENIESFAERIGVFPSDVEEDFTVSPNQRFLIWVMTGQLV